MHYLSHYYCELPNNDPLFVTGLIIPDLTGNFTKAYNSIIKNYVLNKGQDVEPIHNGILHHYEGDRRFHNSEAFMQHMGMALQSFVTQGLNRQRLRLSVLAHVAVEMLIDRQIVLQEESICSSFYEVINKANESLIAKYFDTVVLPIEKKSFLSKFQFFKERRFLFLFKDLENIIFGLNRIYQSSLGIEFTAQETRLLLPALNNIDLVIRYRWKEILKA